jgi:Sec-independent protein translocase protein TatA
MRFFNLGGSEILLLFLFAVLAIGPKETVRLAGQAREIVKSIQGTLSDLTEEVTRVAGDIPDLGKEIQGDNDATSSTS